MWKLWSPGAHSTPVDLEWSCSDVAMARQNPTMHSTCRTQRSLSLPALLSGMHRTPGSQAEDTQEHSNVSIVEVFKACVGRRAAVAWPGAKGPIAKAVRCAGGTLVQEDSCSCKVFVHCHMSCTLQSQLKI